MIAFLNHAKKNQQAIFLKKSAALKNRSPPRALTFLKTFFLPKIKVDPEKPLKWKF